jgi:hypothetical protein
MLKLIPFLSLTLLFLNSCSSDPEPVVVVQEQPELLYTEVAGNFAEPQELEHLRYGENVKGYTVGRYVDPSDPTIMHEQSVIYRLEEPSSWNLQPNLPVSIPFEGTPRKLLTDDDRHLRAEIETKAEDERALYQYLKATASETKKNESVLKKTVLMSKKLADQNKALLEMLKKREAEKLKYEEYIKKQQQQLKKLIEYYELKEREQIKNNRFKRN